MSISAHRKIKFPGFPTTRIGKGKVWLFLIVLFFSSFGVVGQNGVTITSTEQSPTQNNPVPVTFKFDQPVKNFESNDVIVTGSTLENFYVEFPDYPYEGNLGRISDFKLNLLSIGPRDADKATVAIDINQAGRIYALTLNDGVYVYNTNGTASGKVRIIPANEFSEPRDIVVTDKKIYIADSGKNRIVVYDIASSSISYLGEGDLNSPSGLAIGPDNNLYIADTGNNRVAIYNMVTLVQSTPVSGSGSQALRQPIRLAVDNQLNIYVNDLVNNRIQIFNSAKQYSGTIPGGPNTFTTAGSIVVDDYGFIYIADLGDVNLETFLNFDEIEREDIFALASLIATDSARIQVFRRDNLAAIPKTINPTELNIPVDLAFKHCGFLAVNNADAKIGFPAEILFDLKIFNRLPDSFTADLTIAQECKVATLLVPSDVGVNAKCNSVPAQSSSQFKLVWDKTKPVISCLENQEEKLENGIFILPDYSDSSLFSASDNCDTNLTIIQTPSAGTQISSDTNVSLIARDAAGNSSITCNFQVKVSEETDNPPVFQNCPTTTISKNNDLGKCGAIVSFSTPTATDDNGTPTVTRKDNGPLSGELFPVGTHVIVFEASDGVNDPVKCSFEVVITDNEKPVITCPSDITKEIPADQNSVVVEFDKPAPTDNCSGVTVTQTQGLASGSQFTVGTHTIEFTATDATRNFEKCSFTINVNPAEEEPDPVTITCLGNKNDYFGAGCRFEIPDYRNNATFTTGANVTQLPAQGTFVTANTKIILTATLNGESDSCEFELILEDKTLPVFNNCPGSRTVTADSNGNFTVPDYTHLTNVTDNCGTVNLVQFPVEGEIIDETTEIIFTATDANGNTAGCSFTLTLIQQTPPLQISCPGNQEATLGDNCSFMVPDYRNNAGVNPPDAQIVQQPAPGTIITESTSITLTATLGDETDSCSFELNLKDIQNPVFTCIPEQNITFDPDVGYTVPNYREEANPSDNCDFEWVQTPAPNTVIYASQTIEISATDAAGNRTWCSFIVRLTEGEPNELQITCPGNQSAPLDANCEFLVPDYKSLANVNIDGADVTQNPPPSSKINSSTSIQLTATSGNQSVSCDFQLILEDVTAPTITCPSDQLENYDPTVDFALPDYRDLAVTSDACGIAQILQSPSPGTLITQNTTVSLAVTDFSGNSLTCAFRVNLTEDEVIQINCPEDQVVQPSENCSFALPDYTGLAEVNFDGAQVTQAPAPGSQISGNTTVILTASLNGQTDSCAFDVYSIDNTAPLAKCILTGSYRLNENGTLTLNAEQINNDSSDNCGIEGMEINRTQFSTSDIGDHNITLTVKDAAGNLDSCETTISILPYAGNGNDFACKTSVVLELDETGNAVLNSQDLYNGDPQERSFTISKTNFSCSDVGENYINFTYQGNIDSGTCEIKVEVQDNLAPIVQTQNVTINLNTDGLAEITPALINSGTTDNCGIVNFTLDKSSFGCKDLGENMVRLTAVDNNGNPATATAMVTVMGNCKQEPPPGGNGPDEIFIYPNPSPGPFTIATPNGVKIFKVEIFDFRGRFLHSKDFAEDVPAYTMDIWGVEQAVYVLKIYTSDGIRIRRVIKF